uniref:MAPEG family protein n=1 Tax=Strombidium inclinatum TaxID=197538 RepID=A0A7S3IH34_9SPIT|mmetsp:Transcript_16949/g.26096  ORF Transcript_16949/g.26096 Transcript_16949/m.26096 type:complete len:176 (+) Transcript_16949:3-530(+)|eukprot:CAMPEP_0170493246 /NCGR_PEP_ID=MMETSP0208-20121228/13594_1 /TAXON_ID=197538 /ORGANISM="Strombidium inclinatum, Strain S3" /LENGTH=175 /DNA_ID=CAMNT_0010769145 /DNA_START=3 /DNA_END=530 /DNA_ORIENTATION=+
MINVAFPPEYGWVLIASVTAAFQTLFVGFVAGGSRKATFNPEFMENEFGKIHRDAFGPESAPDKEGYPDHGQGRYALALPYKAWYEFNLRQRCHGNVLESISQLVLYSLIAGIKFPLTSAVITLIYILARIVFVMGYLSDPKYRLRGFAPSMACMTTLMVLAFVSLFQILGDKKD